MRKAVIGWILVVVGALILWYALTPRKVMPAPVDNRLPTLTIGTSTLSVELAETEAEREQGLSGREALSPGAGMLFVFDAPTKPGFWMKDMKFSLDIVWISADWRIVGVDRSLSPESYPQVFAPPTPVQYALEVPSGYFDRHGFYIGESVSKDF